MFAAAFAILGVVAPIVFFATKNPETPVANRAIGSSCCAVVFLLPAAIIGNAVVLSSEKTVQAIRKLERRLESLLDEAEGLTARSCATKYGSVRYEGWYGTIHTFEFASGDYAEAFCRSNLGKIVE